MYIPNVDILITTYKRPECLHNLMRSIRCAGIENHIYIGDQTAPEYYAEKYAGATTHVVKLPDDCGLSYARNRLVEASTAPYVLILEDDFEFTYKTNIWALKDLMLARKNVGVVGGMVTQHDIPIHFEFIPSIENGVLYHRRDGDHWHEFAGTKYKATGAVLNFALMHRAIFEDVKWDEQLKLREHQDFYIRLQKTKWHVLYTPDVVIKDAKPKRYTPEYSALKSRDEFLVKMMEKHGIHKIVYQNGTTRELENGKIACSKEAPL